MPSLKRLTIRLGGSNRKLDRQLKALSAAGVELHAGGCASLGIHHSNQRYSVEDTPETRALVKSVGGTIPRRQ